MGPGWKDGAGMLTQEKAEWCWGRVQCSWRQHIVMVHAGADITPSSAQDLDHLWECGAQGCTVNWPDVARQHITEKHGGMGDRH